MARRLCYVHVGPHKTGTTAIQWFLKENRAELLRRGVLVPLSGSSKSGVHQLLVRQLCGDELRSVYGPVIENFKRELEMTPSEIVIVSSEDLDGLLPKAAGEFFAGLQALDLEPRIVIFPRNQPQWLNSYYAQSVKSFRTADPFQAYVRRRQRNSHVSYLFWIAMCASFRAGLTAVPFNSENAARGVVPLFLAAAGLDATGLKDSEIRLNDRIGPFTVSCARRVMRPAVIGGSLTRLQAVRCRRALEEYLVQAGLQDDGYCGLTSSLATDIEAACRADNDAFSEQVWSRPWNEVFSDDVGRSFEPNDYASAGVPDRLKHDLRTTISVVGAAVEKILRNPALAVRARWNELGSYF